MDEVYIVEAPALWVRQQQIRSLLRTDSQFEFNTTELATDVYGPRCVFVIISDRNTTLLLPEVFLAASGIIKIHARLFSLIPLPGGGGNVAEKGKSLTIEPTGRIKRNERNKSI